MERLILFLLVKTVAAPTNNTSTTSHLSLHLDDFLVFKTTVEKVIEVDKERV